MVFYLIFRQVYRNLYNIDKQNQMNSYSKKPHMGFLYNLICTQSLL